MYKKIHSDGLGSGYNFEQVQVDLSIARLLCKKKLSQIRKRNLVMV